MSPASLLSSRWQHGPTTVEARQQGKQSSKLLLIMICFSKAAKDTKSLLSWFAFQGRSLQSAGCWAATGSCAQLCPRFAHFKTSYFYCHNPLAGPLDTPMIEDLLADHRTHQGMFLKLGSFWMISTNTSWIQCPAVVRTMFEDLKRTGALLKPSDSAGKLVALLRWVQSDVRVMIRAMMTQF